MSTRDVAEAGEDDGIICMANVTPEKVKWMWQPYVAFGKLTCVDGDPEAGKSWFTLAIAAAVTGGPKPPGMGAAEPAAVLLLATEDDAADTIRPRLDIVRAKVARVFQYATSLKFDPAGLTKLRELITSTGAKLVIVDPLDDYLPPNMNSWKTNEVRPVMTCLGKVAEDLGVAVLLIRHLHKASARGKAIYAAANSIGFTAVARSVLMIGHDPASPGTHIVAHLKNNLGPHGPSIAYVLADDQFLWNGLSPLTAEDLVSGAQSGREQDRLDEAKEFLMEALRDGPRLSDDVESEARSQGIAKRTLSRAKRELDIVSRKDGSGGRWRWRLAAAATARAA